MRKLLILSLFALTAAACSPQKTAQTTQAPLTVFAAASTTDVMKELAEAYQKAGGADVKFNFASSGALARQIDAGTPADLFISANTKWMNFLDDNAVLLTGTRVDLVKNALVLIAPKESSMTYAGFPGNLKGKLAVGDFKSVPAGTYAEAALTALGWLDDVESHLVKGANVRTVLMYVERAEADAGIVYQTDAMRSDKVNVLGTFPAETHPAIVYPAACLKEGAAAKEFLAFIQSAVAKAIWEKHGFIPAAD